MQYKNYSIYEVIEDGICLTKDGNVESNCRINNLFNELLIRAENV